MSRLDKLLNTDVWPNTCLNSTYVKSIWLSSDECLRAPCGSCQVYLPNLEDAAVCLD